MPFGYFVYRNLLYQGYSVPILNLLICHLVTLCTEICCTKFIFRVKSVKDLNNKNNNKKKNNIKKASKVDKASTWQQKDKNFVVVVQQQSYRNEKIQHFKAGVAASINGLEVQAGSSKVRRIAQQCVFRAQTLQ